MPIFVKTKNMAYRDFKLSDLENKLGIKTVQTPFLPKKIVPVKPSDWLLQTLDMKRKIKPNTTEKAVSESIIDPILTEITVLNSNKITLFSGENLNADRHQGLNGEVDFLLVHRKEALEMSEPIINITEAKLDRAIEKSIAQAGAQMIGARIFNQNYRADINIIHGAVTNGKNWIFLKLQDDILYVDNQKDYSTNDLDEILGILQLIINFYN
jgi:hypothetical protein